MFVRGISPTAQDKFVKLPVRHPEVKALPEAGLTASSLPEEEPWAEPVSTQELIDAVRALVDESEDGWLRNRLLIVTIAELIAWARGVTLAEIRGQSRSREFAWARQEAWYITRLVLGCSLPTIARYYENRDHTTVLHGIKRHAKRLAESPQ